MGEKASRASRSMPALPLPAQRARLNIQRTFTDEEYERLSQGLIPLDMDDRWFIFMEEDTLFFHRSWTGICIYEVHLDSGHSITEAWVNREWEQYQGVDLEYDRKELLFLIDNFLLGKDRPYTDEWHS
jgi:hypothetical protein